MVQKKIINNFTFKLRPKWSGKKRSNHNEKNSFAEFSNPGLASERLKREMIDRLFSQGIKDEIVLEAMLKVPRHLFVDSALSSRAYEDNALPIGFQQTISQPYIVGRMISLAIKFLSQTKNQNLANAKILEIGTGCGYQTAVLDKCFGKVFSIERIFLLHQESKKRLSGLCPTVETRFGDGLDGWSEKAPFNVIIFSGNMEIIPVQLLKQTSKGGLIVMPFGKSPQNLVVLVKTDNLSENYKKYVFDLVRFVPILSGIEK